MGSNGIPLCRKCRGEKIRQGTGGGYRYVCHCEEWREQMRLLERARELERRRGR